MKNKLNNNIKRLMMLVLSTLMVIGTLTGCAKQGNLSQEENYTKEMMGQAIDKVGMPEITNFYERSMAKEIFELRDDSDLICYVYSYVPMTGKYIYIGRSMGYGLPYSTQFTQPETVQKKRLPDFRVDGSESEVSFTTYSEVMPQADPNGLYTPTGLSATWLQMIDEETGERYIWYCEPEIVVTGAKMPKRLIDPDSLEGVDY